MSNLTILKRTIKDFKRSWSVALIASLPLNLLPSVFIFDKTVGLLFFLILSGPLRTILSRTTLLITQQKLIKTEEIFSGFISFKNALGVFLLSLVFIVLGGLLFIVPGIIIAIWLSQSFFIMVQYPSLEPMEVFKKSKEMMKGNELKYINLFLLFFSFSVIILYFNLLFLSILIAPIQYIAFAHFYNSIDKK
ncbi:MAG: hypothetical protein ACN4EF_07685 [Wenyingzhuangia sp.]|jgi:uncharacterized membrane protein|uniref:hypothetical protein n=1 Tax=Wenyingzhuangia sp. TaxID=1964193 RepID=UPI00321B9594